MLIFIVYMSKWTSDVENNSKTCISLHCCENAVMFYMHWPKDIRLKYNRAVILVLVNVVYALMYSIVSPKGK